MANGFGTSLGYGIGLQGILPEQDNSLLKYGLQEQRAKREKSAKLKQAEIDKYKDDLDKYNIIGIHPIYSQDVALQAAKLNDIARQAQAENPNGNWTNSAKLQDALLNFKKIYNDNKVASDFLVKDTNELANNPTKFTGQGTEEWNKFQEAMSTNNPEVFKEYRKSQGKSELYTGGQEFWQVNEPKPVYYLDKFQQTVKPTIASSSSEKPKGEYFVTESGSYFDVDKNRALAEQNATKNTLAGATAIAAKIKESGVDEATAQKLVEEEFYNNLKARAGIKNSQSIQEAKTGAGSAVANSKKNLSLVLNTYGGQDNMQFQFKDIKDNVPLDFLLQNGEAVKGIPKSFVKNKNGTYDLHVAVPVYEYKTVVDQAGNPVQQKMETGRFEDRAVDYKSGADVIKTEYGFDPYEVLNGTQPKNIEVIKREKPVSKTSAPAAGSKTVSSATIKALVGTKGYEGYTEKELSDYYKSQGYNVK